MRFSMTNVVVFNDIQLLFRFFFTVFISTKWKLKEILYCIITLRFLFKKKCMCMNAILILLSSQFLNGYKTIQGTRNTFQFYSVRKKLHLQSIQSLLKYQIHFLSFIPGNKSTYTKHRCLFNTDSTKIYQVPTFQEIKIQRHRHILSTQSDKF